MARVKKSREVFIDAEHGDDEVDSRETGWPS
jgi:hypothetical protein